MILRRRPRPSPPPAPALLLLAAALAASWAAGCSRPSPPVLASAPAEAPWAIPASALGTQRLFRVNFDGPEGDGSFRVTLRFGAEERYQLQAVDPLGRALFTLDVSEGAGLLLNHRSRAFCRFQGSFETRDLPLGPFPLVALPALLLDRVPVVPPVAPALAATIEFEDAKGRGWSVNVARSGAPISWTLREGGSPTVWWARRDGWSLLSDRARSVQIRWRQVVEEALPGPIARLEVPAGYRENPCGAPDLPHGDGGDSEDRPPI